mmetsp:Transcript_19687/g.22659  ORF Transcript_19687/g.22659 Transcript_19687/m.22659 type:complete len:501 (+) Transcript_19687:1-1503(+)
MRFNINRRERKNMNLPRRFVYLTALTTLGCHAQEELPGMVKMCLFYPNESGHARSDPILKQDGPSDHVHTFYGPQNFHPDTTYEQLRDTKPEFSSSPIVENQSLYWHPSIYRVTEENGESVYSRANNLESSPYYRWNMDTLPATVAFPPGFRMIAYSDDAGADAGGETGGNMLVECCDFLKNGEEDCVITGGNPLIFPTTACEGLGIAFAMPTCWDESKGIGTDDPFGHVAYTTDGAVGGPCPSGFNKRIPQVHLFVRIKNYQGGVYQLADGNDKFHVDFMNGWQEGKLLEIMQGCEPSGEEGYNPPCGCNQFLTENTDYAKPLCDEEVRQHMIDEATDVVNILPRASNSNAGVVPKTWEDDEDPPFVCAESDATMFIKKFEVKIKKKKTTFIPKVVMFVRDDLNTSFEGAEVTIYYEYEKGNGKMKEKSISKITNDEGKVVINLGKIPKGTPVTIELEYITKEGDYVYDGTKNEQNDDGCPVFSSECSVVTCDENSCEY